MESVELLEKLDGARYIRVILLEPYQIVGALVWYGGNAIYAIDSDGEDVDVRTFKTDIPLDEAINEINEWEKEIKDEILSDDY